MISFAVLEKVNKQTESIGFIFDENQQISGFVKTGFAPNEIHEQVAKLFYELKPLMKKLSYQLKIG
ncbi:hypothetical protein [Brevibacillus sp. SYSU BS000544]|uniref:hypothetical protein n=1 Tax=Brevibacillus sp. SYSU BS000544 TaxID=3416443 RepID=UPI003CE4D85A